MHKVEQAFQLKARMKEMRKLQNYIKQDYRDLDLEFESLISTMTQAEQQEYARRMTKLQEVAHG